MPDPGERQRAAGGLQHLDVGEQLQQVRLPIRSAVQHRAGKPAQQVARETGAKYGGVLYVDSLSDSNGPVPTYIDLLRVTAETITKGLTE